VVEAGTPKFWNLSWLLIGDPPDGTFYFNNEPNLLDQFLVNKNMATSRNGRRPQTSSLNGAKGDRRDVR
jgi:hypothetical protein